MEKFIQATETICAIVDVQYFMYRGKPIPRTLALESGNYSLHFDVSTGLNRDDFDERDFKTNSFLRHRYNIDYDVTHGEKHIPGAEFAKTLYGIYLWMRSEEKPNFGVKNFFLMKLLDKMEIPYVSLDDLEIPAWKSIQLPFQDGYCQGSPHVALRKVRTLYNYIDVKLAGAVALDTGFDEVDK